MDDLSNLISSILSDPDSVQQLQALASQMGLAGDGGAENSQTRSDQLLSQNTNRQNSNRSSQNSGNARNSVNQQQPAVQQSSGSLPNVDFDALSRVLSGLTGKPQAASNNAPDLSALQNLLGNTNTGSTQQQNSGGGLDLSALQGLLGNTGTGNTQQQNSGGGLDLSALQGLLGNTGTDNTQQQNSGGGLDLSALQGLLGNTGTDNTQQQNSGGDLDLSALQSLLGNASAGGTQQNTSGGSDLAATLSGLLSGAGTSGSTDALSGLLGSAAGQTGNSSVSALANMLGGGSQGQSGGGLLSGIDIGTIMKIQQAMSGLGAGQENIRLLMGLKSRLTTDRAQKVDDAIRVMQLIQFLPLIKESGILSGLDDLLGRFNLGSLLGGGSGGLGNLLSGLNLFGGR